jgi:transcriptional regulator with XRE-family HTH domain
MPCRIVPGMARTLRVEAITQRLQERGWTQAQLAEAVGVSNQTVTNWLAGSFPRPRALLKLAVTLGLAIDKLVETRDAAEPVVAFRKKAGAKTTDEHINKARGIGYLLKPLVSALPETRQLRTLITSPSCDYAQLRKAVEQTRSELGIGQHAVLSYSHLIGQFKKNAAILVPVLWGKKGNHENALHIRLPDEDVTFVFLNLDVRIEDFKFWMAHELAHVYTPELAGTEKGEDFADAFAGALLFPHECAESAYREACGHPKSAAITVLSRYAHKHQVSLNTVHQQVKRFAEQARLRLLPVDDKTIHRVRNSVPAQTVSEALFDPLPPEASSYISVASSVFQSDFFVALERMVKERGVGAGYIQQVLDVPLKDSMSIHGALVV